MISFLKYDVAISVAEEDKWVAEQIIAELKKRDIHYYYYGEQAAESWGRYLISLTGDIYGRRSRYILLITSRIFVNKYWSGIERQIAIVNSIPGKARILQLRLDETPVDGISKHVVHHDWQHNPGEIAEMLFQKISTQVGTEKRRRTRYYMIGLIILLFMSLIYFFSIPTTKDFSPVLESRKMQVSSPADTFFISETEVTIGQYRAFCEQKDIDLPPQLPSVYENSPVVNVTWEEALAFCKWKQGRLPTEKEWEYAAGAGLAVKYSGGNNASKAAIYNRKKPSRVASRMANAFGLYDMTGNVSEWCDDWSDTSAIWKSVRGGSYHSTIKPVNELLIAYRSKELPGSRRPDIGFRVAWDKN